VIGNEKILLKFLIFIAIIAMLLFTALKPVTELVQLTRLLYLQHFNNLNRKIGEGLVAFEILDGFSVL
jgi:hypothetical protein